MEMFNSGLVPVVNLNGVDGGGLFMRGRSGFGSFTAGFNGEAVDAAITFSDRNRTMSIGGVNREIAVYDRAHTKRFAAGYYWENIDRATTRDWVSLRWFAPNGETIVKEITAEDK